MRLRSPTDHLCEMWVAEPEGSHACPRLDAPQSLPFPSRFSAPLRSRPAGRIVRYCPSLLVNYRVLKLQNSKYER
jgi:hypothetical protein